jgi:hypothetical protein
MLVSFSLISVPGTKEVVLRSNETDPHDLENETSVDPNEMGPNLKKRLANLAKGKVQFIS